ncbi:hypothetical protein HYH03_011695 [Edaphochlamys debaryana]|uniref:Uncharacterized protein n=1 Tax=Edaphochlamys debaryana TaxID=47281 RepID=A0A835XVM3_9CHLO|nr:hypothetical protein HYH03_011695 [Edaphochlamys debaryana]|eukprot:KAG2489893.1 hypothetical protein HYH03_011695 [Edaphochlamys debaryana]
MASLDRLPLLEAQCKSFPGPLSAAIYLPLLLATGAGPAGPSPWRRHRRGRRRAPRGAESGSGAGRHSAGAHYDTAGRLREAIETLEALFSRLESAPSACAPVLALYSERLADPALAALMPTNALRNAALLPAATPLAAMVDADLSASAGLGGLVGNGSWASDLVARAQRSRSVWLLPAWETARSLGEAGGHGVAGEALAGDKAALARLWLGEAAAQALASAGRSGPCTAGQHGSGSSSASAAAASAGSTACGQLAAAAAADAAGAGPPGSGRLYPFALREFAGGHGPTDYLRFLTTDEPYKVPYVEGFEPWFVADRFALLPYDELFRGWYGDKISQVKHQAAHRFAFHVLPGAWLVHRPHAPAPAAAIFRREAGAQAHGVNALLQKTVRRFVRRSKFDHYVTHNRNLDYWQRRGQARGTYEPQRSAGFERCRSLLPWWREGGQERAD